MRQGLVVRAVGVDRPHPSALVDDSVAVGDHTGLRPASVSCWWLVPSASMIPTPFACVGDSGAVG